MQSWIEDFFKKQWKGGTFEGVQYITQVSQISGLLVGLFLFRFSKKKITKCVFPKVH